MKLQIMQGALTCLDYGMARLFGDHPQHTTYNSAVKFDKLHFHRIRWIAARLEPDSAHRGYWSYLKYA